MDTTKDNTTVSKSDPTTTNNTTAASVAAAQPVQDNTKYLMQIECSIRRKPNTVGLPGQDPNERNYRIGASLDLRTKGNLKGISGELEIKFMPEIIGVSANDPIFRRSVDEYWSSISKPVPPDEPFQKEHEKGAKLKVSFHLQGKVRKERMDSKISVEEKMAYLNELVLTIPNGGTVPVAIIDYESISDYLLLNYCLKYSKVANNSADKDLSPKIDFYLYEKEVAVKNHLNLIDLRSKAMMLYQTLVDSPRKIDSVLLMFKKNPNEFETSTDKLIEIDKLYNESPMEENMRAFVRMVEDVKWETKYLINAAIAADKLRNPINSTAIYYNDILLGMNMDEAALYLDNEERGVIIKGGLARELKIS